MRFSKGNAARSGRPPSQRQLRVGEMLRRRLASAIGTVDPVTVGDTAPERRVANVTVTQVRLSPDLRHAVAYVMPLGGDHVDGVVTALNEAAPRLKKIATTGWHLKYVPSLSFAADDSFAHGAAMDALLNGDVVRRDLESDPDPIA